MEFKVYKSSVKKFLLKLIFFQRKKDKNLDYYYINSFGANLK